MLGVWDGVDVGDPLAVTVGPKLGAELGLEVGSLLGTLLGALLGTDVLGVADGVDDGFSVLRTYSVGARLTWRVDEPGAFVGGRYFASNSNWAKLIRSELNSHSVRGKPSQISGVQQIRSAANVSSTDKSANFLRSVSGQSDGSSLLQVDEFHPRASNAHATLCSLRNSSQSFPT